MLSRILRTRACESRKSPGSGRSGSPMRTMSPASAARSLPTPPKAIPTVAIARAGASLTPSPDHRDATSLLGFAIRSTAPCRSATGSACTSSIRSQRSATNWAASARSPVNRANERTPASSQLTQNTVGSRRGLRRERPERRKRDCRRQPTASLLPVAPSGKLLLQGRRELDLLRLHQVPGCRRRTVRSPSDDRSPAHGPSTVARTLATTPAPGWAVNSAAAGTTRLRDSASRTIIRASRCSLRRSAIAATRSNSVSSNGATRRCRQAATGRGERSRLVEGDRVDGGQSLESDRAFHDDAGAGQPGHRGNHGRRRRQDEWAGTGDDQHAERRFESVAPRTGREPPREER